MTARRQRKKYPAEDHIKHADTMSRWRVFIFSVFAGIVVLCFLIGNLDTNRKRSTSNRHLGKVVIHKDFAKVDARKKYFRGVFVGYRRSRARQYPQFALLQIDGCTNKEDARYFLGKKCAYIYKAKTKKKGSLYRCMWGKVVKTHGNGGTVRATFKKNLPTSALYKTVRVMRYPDKENDESKNPYSVDDFNSTHFTVRHSNDHQPPKRWFWPDLWLPFMSNDGTEKFKLPFKFKLGK
mmetsp:Transcript_18807/g.26474  ORF Transcript_18807/g.26474 Transcript_18807/m.26474 type:complete len:237 (+) Transcript_18807:156-866(+)